MKVIIHTNIDAYKGTQWPVFIDHVPRKGEIIECEAPTRFNTKYPPRLEVVRVLYKSKNKNNPLDGTYAYVELWFNETDFKLYGGGEKLLN